MIESILYRRSCADRPDNGFKFYQTPLKGGY
jgi:hypothetical protein